MAKCHKLDAFKQRKGTAGRYSSSDSSAYLQVAKRVNLESSHHKKNNALTVCIGRCQVDVLWQAFRNMYK